MYVSQYASVDTIKHCLPLAQTPTGSNQGFQLTVPCLVNYWKVCSPPTFHSVPQAVAYLYQAVQKKTVGPATNQLFWTHAAIWDRDWSFGKWKWVLDWEREREKEEKDLDWMWNLVVCCVHVWDWNIDDMTSTQPWFIYFSLPAAET